MLIAAFAPIWFLESFDMQTLAPILFGGIFMLVGIVVAFAAFASDPMVSIMFGVTGGLIFVTGMVRALKA